MIGDTSKVSKVAVIKDLMLLIKAMTDGTENGVIIIDHYGSVTGFNAIAERLLGVPSTHILENSYRELGDIVTIVDDSIVHRVNFSNVNVDFNHSGVTKYCLLDTMHIMDDDSYRGTFVQLRDVTENRILEQELIVAERLATVGQLAAGLAHEIRNPLTTISGFLQIMQSSGDYAKIGEYIRIVSEELNRLKKLVSDFVVVSKPTKSIRKDVSLQTFISDVSELMSAQAALKGIEIATDYVFDGDVTISIDESQIKQVLINAIQNSIEAIEGTDGKVTLACNYDGLEGLCCISIIDTGIGMDEYELSKVMTPFFTTKESGTGLGLSVSYRIVKDHGGVMKFSSQKGVGTRVDIYLPLKEMFH